MSCQTIHFRVLDKSPVSGPGRGPPSCNKWWLWQGFFFTVIDILTSWGTEGPPCLPMDWTQWPQLWPFCHWSPSDPRVPWLGKEKETLLNSLPFPLTFLSLTPPILPFFSSPLVLDSGIWSKGLSLGWGLETDHLVFWESYNFGSVPVWSCFWYGQVPVWRPRVKSHNTWVSAGVLLPPSPTSFPLFFQPGFLPPFEIFEDLGYFNLFFSTWIWSSVSL